MKRNKNKNNELKKDKINFPNLSTKSIEIQDKSSDDEEEEEEEEEKDENDISMAQKISQLIKEEKDESVLKIVAQISVPYLVAGFGMVLAGNVLNIVKDWPVFRAVPQTLTMVPALLGLKGNLEMTLTSRLSTQANLGTLSDRGERRELVVGNLLLSQFQSLVVGFLAALVAVCLADTSSKSDLLEVFVLLALSAMVTTSLASLLLGILMTTVVITSHHFHLNPDNVATPIAGSLGDLITITLLAGITSTIYHLIEISPWLIYTTLFLFLIISLPFYFHVCRCNKYSRDVLWGAWVPILVAMVISSLGGVILEDTICHYEGLALLQPLVNGIGGNLVGIQASRQSTLLHKLGPPGTEGKVHFNVWGCSTCSGVFSCKYLGSASKTALQLLVAPGHVFFLFLVWLLHHDGDNDVILTTITSTTFVAAYLAAVVIQVSILLALSDVIVPQLWKANHDPDSCALPYLTAVGDVLGIVLLAAAFKLHAAWGDTILFF